MPKVTNKEYNSMTERLSDAGLLDVLDLLEEFAMSGELEIKGRK
jgi:hypothetical protein